MDNIVKKQVLSGETNIFTDKRLWALSDREIVRPSTRFDSGEYNGTEKGLGCTNGIGSAGWYQKSLLGVRKQIIECRKGNEVDREHS